MADLKEILLSKNIVIPKNFEFFKDIFRHFRGKEVRGIEGDDRPLLEKASEFYLTPEHSGGFLQGDILDNLTPTWLAKDSKGILSAFVSNPQLGMILSNECDCEQRTEGSQSFVRICPVFFESQLIKELEISKEKIKGVMGNLKANHYTEYFWMPKPSYSQENLIADLSHIFSVSLEDLYENVNKK